MRPAPAPRRRLSRPDRERQLLTVAEQVFAERGYRAASMDEVAEAAGVTKPVLYDHFGSKEGLLAACIAKGRVELHAETVAAVAGLSAPRDVLRAGLRAFFAFVDVRGKGWADLLRETAVSPVAAEGLAAGRQDQAELTAALLEQVLPGSPPEVLALQAQAVNGACERVALWWREEPGLSVDEVTDLLTDLLWPGLASAHQER
jgi:AcrR family transcriptional regulator